MASPLLFDRGVDLAVQRFPEAGDGGHQSRLIALKIVGKGLAGRVNDATAGGDSNIFSGALEHVPGRQNRQPAIFMLEGDEARQLLDLVHQVGMGQHHSFGASGGSRSVDQSQGVVRPDPAPASNEFADVVRRQGAVLEQVLIGVNRRKQLVPIFRLDDEGNLQLLQVGGHLLVTQE